MGTKNIILGMALLTLPALSNAESDMGAKIDAMAKSLLRLSKVLKERCISAWGKNMVWCRAINLK